MNPGGVVILIAGVWLGCQVFGGDMLKRLGIVTDTASNSKGGYVAPAVATGTGTTGPAVVNV